MPALNIQQLLHPLARRIDGRWLRMSQHAGAAHNDRSTFPTRRKPPEQALLLQERSAAAVLAILAETCRCSDALLLLDRAARLHFGAEAVGRSFCPCDTRPSRLLVLLSSLGAISKPLPLLGSVQPFSCFALKTGWQPDANR